MNYRVLLFQTAQKDLTRLDKSVLDRIQAAFLEIGDNPRGRHAKKLKAAKGVYRWRVGDFRVVYEIDDGKREVYVHRVVDRKDAY